MESPYVAIEDLAKYFAVSVSTVRAWVRQEIIPKDTYIKIGATYRFNVGAVDAALTGKPQEAVNTETADVIVEVEPVQLELDFGTNLDEDN
jgi:excisionase family DNA binding protein